MDVLAGVCVALVLLWLAYMLVFDRQPALVHAAPPAVEEDTWGREMRYALKAEDRAWLESMGWKDSMPRPVHDQFVRSVLTAMHPQFVVMYHPQLNNARAQVSIRAVDHHAERGWLLAGQHSPEPPKHLG